MDKLPLAFIGGMILLGGLSAYVADILGYKIGKKRLSIWHIRPKYVARTSVTVAGMLIPLVSVLLIAALSADFRLWVTKGRAAIAEAQQKTAEVAEKTKQLDQVDKELKSTQAQRILLAKGLDESKKAIAAQKGIGQKLSATISRQQAQLSGLEAAVRRAESLVRNSKAESLRSRGETQKTLQILSKTRKLLETEKGHLQQVQKLFDTTLQEKNIAETDKRRALEEFDKLTAANLSLQSNNAELNKTLAELQIRLPDLSAEIEKLKEERAQANKELAELDNKIEAGSRLVLQIQRENSTYSTFSRQSNLMFVKGEELGRIIVPGGMNDLEARNLLFSLLRLTRSAAIAKGAKPDLNYPFSQESGLLENRPDRTEMTNVEAEALWAKRFQSSRETRLVVARAATNRFAGEPVTLELTLYPNPVVFREREVIAEGRADGREPDQVIYGQIRDFVRTYVNAKARRVKMIPVSGRDGDSFGELSAESLFEALAVIRSTGRLLRLQAVAKRDIRAGEQLDFELVVR